jgi:regulator of replication initiation timing
MNSVSRSILASCILMVLCARINAQSKRDQIESLNHKVDSLKSTIEVLISESVTLQLSMDTEIKSLMSQMEDCERQQKQTQAKLDASSKSVGELTLENTGLKYELALLHDSLRNCQVVKKQSPNDFIPEGYVVFDTKYGDLNKDGSDDCVLIIKGTENSQITTDEIDRNRRGIIVLFNRNRQYELVLQNYDCFSSENEDGGNYYPPELSVEIESGNLFVQYSHGRYGVWGYEFRFQNSNFELISYYNSENDGPVINTFTRIDFSTKTKLFKVNTNENDGGGEEVFSTTTNKILIDQLIKLADIKDFDVLDMSIY